MGNNDVFILLVFAILLIWLSSSRKGRDIYMILKGRATVTYV